MWRRVVLLLSVVTLRPIVLLGLLCSLEVIHRLVVAHWVLLRDIREVVPVVLLAVAEAVRVVLVVLTVEVVPVVDVGNFECMDDKIEIR